MKYLTALLVVLLLVVPAFGNKREKYVPDSTVTPEKVKRAAEAVPKIRDMMKDPDSFVLEHVYLRESTDKYDKHPNGKPAAFCFFFRSHNSYGGYSGQAEVLLDEKDRISFLDSRNSDDNSGIYNGLFTCTPKRRLADITAEVQSALNPKPTPPPAQTPEEAARRAQQYADCMKAAVGNPSIVCQK